MTSSKFPEPDDIRKKYNFVELESIKNDEWSCITKVRDQNDGKLYIQKQIKNKAVYNPEIVRQIRDAYINTDEAERVAIPIDVLEDEQYFYEIMHYFEAWTMADILTINQNGVYGSLFEYWTKDLISLLCPLHRRHLVHCDINPYNVLVTKDDGVRLILIDFSSAISLNDPREHEYILHCSGFTAPEIIKGDTYSTSADIYSVGALLSYINTRKLPPNLDDRTHGRKYVKLTNVRSYERMIHKMFALNPNFRLKNAEEVSNWIESPTGTRRVRRTSLGSLEPVDQEQPVNQEQPIDQDLLGELVLPNARKIKMYSTRWEWT